MKVKIREATAADAASIIKLIKELADYEHAPQEVEVTEKILIEDGFGASSFFKAKVAESADGEIVGMILFYYGYSTWKGKLLYIDDLIVTEKERRSGIGKLLFDAAVEDARKENVKQMRWHVLNWNDPAINFYKKINANLDPEWITCKLSESGISRYL